MLRIPMTLAVLGVLATALGWEALPGSTARQPTQRQPAITLRSSWAVDSVAGRTIDAQGRPVIAVELVLRSGGRTIGATTSRSDGTFVLRLRGTEPGPWVLRAGRLGYTPVEQALEPQAGWTEIVLHEAPLPLPAIQVEGVRETCEGPEDPLARRLWTRAAARHAGGLDTLGIASYTLVRVDTLWGDASTGSEGGAERAEPGQRGSAPLLRLSWSRRVEREGYAFPVRRTDSERSYASWSYPPLEADFAFHFGDRRFGELNRFVLHREDREGWVLLYCSEDRGQPYLEGRLELSLDTLITFAQWAIQTPEPQEHAGGWARFPPAGPGKDAYLLPSESLTWRTLPDSTVLRRAQWYEGWSLAEGDSVPFLPSR